MAQLRTTWRQSTHRLQAVGSRVPLQSRRQPPPPRLLAPALAPVLPSSLQPAPWSLLGLAAVLWQHLRQPWRLEDLAQPSMVTRYIQTRQPVLTVTVHITTTRTLAIVSMVSTTSSCADTIFNLCRTQLLAHQRSNNALLPAMDDPTVPHSRSTQTNATSSE